MANLDEYEREVEADIRKLKTRLALVTEARKRKAKKLENLEKLPPERIVFGGKKLYSEKDVVEVTKSDDSSNDKDQKTSKKASDKWRQEFFEKRHQRHFRADIRQSMETSCVNMMGKICLLPA